MMHQIHTNDYAGDDGKVPEVVARLDLKARRVAALRDVSRAALAFADHLEAGGEMPYHLERTPYQQATDRASEQLRNSPGECYECDCTIPEDTYNWDGTPLPPGAGCTLCQGSGSVEYWTPALDSSPLLFEDCP